MMQTTIEPPLDKIYFYVHLNAQVVTRTVDRLLYNEQLGSFMLEKFNNCFAARICEGQYFLFFNFQSIKGAIWESSK